MIYCANCGTGNRDGSRFCNECGQPLGEYRTCPLCEGLNHRTSRFCSQCGSKLDAPASAPPSAPVSPAATTVFTDAFASAIHASAEDLPLEVEAPDLAALLADPPTIVAVPPDAAPPRPEIPAASDRTGGAEADEWSDLVAAIESTVDMQPAPETAPPLAGQHPDMGAPPDFALPADFGVPDEIEVPHEPATAPDVAPDTAAAVDGAVGPELAVPSHLDAAPDFAPPEVSPTPGPELAVPSEPMTEPEAPIPSEPVTPRVFASPPDSDLMLHPALEAPPVSPNGIEPSSEDVLASTWLASAAEPSLAPEVPEPEAAQMGDAPDGFSLAGNPLFAVPPESGLSAEVPALDVALSPEELPNWLDSTERPEAQDSVAGDAPGAAVRPLIEPDLYPRPTVQVVAGISLAHSGRAGLSPSAAAAVAPKPRLEPVAVAEPVAPVLPPVTETPRPKDKPAGGRSHGWIVVLVLLLVLLGAVAVAYQAGYLSPDLLKLP